MQHLLEGLSWLGFLMLALLVTGALAANLLKLGEWLYTLWGRIR